MKWENLRGGEGKVLGWKYTPLYEKGIKKADHWSKYTTHPLFFFVKQTPFSNY